MKETPDTLVFYGGAVKALGEGRVGGYLIRFTTDADPDLTGEFFDRDTDLGLEDGDRLPVFYHHGYDPTVKNARIGRGTVKVDDVGVWIEAQLALRTDYERAIYGMAEAGKLGWSSGAVGHLVSYSQHGKAVHIDSWPPGEASLTPTPAEPRNAALPVKSLPAPPPLLGGDGLTISVKADTADAEAALGRLQERADALAKSLDNLNTATAIPPDNSPTDTPMEKDQNTTDETVGTADATKADPPAKTFTAEEAQAMARAAADAALKAFKPEDGRTVKGAVDTPPALVDSSAWRYDNLSVGELATMISVLDEGQHASSKNRPASPDARKALARRLFSEEVTKDPARYAAARQAAKAAGLDAAKANELNYSTQANYGDEWIGVAYSGDLWETIRYDTGVVRRLPQFEFPAGAESMVIPMEGGDPVFYKVPQSTSVANPDVGPAATVPSSKVGTDSGTITLSKLGARVLWTGELNEDAVLPFASYLRGALVRAGAEYLESAIIDGDTATDATTNINDIAGTPAATDYFLVWDGFRKLPLVTNTANSRSAGTLTSSDYLATVQMLGENGMYALDKNAVSILQSAGVGWKALELEDVKTRDVNSSATIESGMLTRMFGYEVLDAPWMHLKAPYRQGGKANTSGKVDQDTAGNNTTGSILAVRWDQWRFYWRRRMTTEVERIARADAYEIVCLMRAALTYRDTEASAISYGVTL